MPKQLHALITSLLITALVNFLRDHPVAWVLNELSITLPNEDLMTVSPTSQSP